MLWDSGLDGKGEVVALLDSGIASTALPLFRKVLQGYDFVSNMEISKDGDCRDPNPLDPGDADPALCPTSSWHGTYVDLIAYATHSSQFSGIAYNAALLNMWVLGRCKACYSSDVADAVVWAAGGKITGVEDNMFPASTVLMAFSGRGVCPRGRRFNGHAGTVF
jgi:serine protease